MPRPVDAVAAIRRAAPADGTWLIKDIRSGPAWQDNLRNPVPAMMTACPAANCRRPGLPALGSLPWDARLSSRGSLAERMCREAGFSRFAAHTHFDDPVNLYYEVRP